MKKEKVVEIEFGVQAKVPKEAIGWLETDKLPKFMMSRLLSYIETAKKNPVNLNDTLAGNISKSLTLKDKDDWFFQTVIIPLIVKFGVAFPEYSKKQVIFTEDVPFCLDTFWVNFQKQHEFNPMHDHNGVFSFVIFVKIPTDWREQHALPFSANSNSPKASDFEFQYTTMLGYIQQEKYLLNKESEGCMLFFPAKLMHNVHPFYNCDKERISISGNISFDTNENTLKEYNSQVKGKNDKKSS